jgi:hypothetical protein
LSKKSIGLLICTILIFLLVASAMAVENKSANESFTNRDYLTAKSIESTAIDSSSAESSIAADYLRQNTSESGINDIMSFFLLRI